MALHYITGVAGTGKSTLRALLEQKGYLAYDADLDGITGWHHITTGKPVYGPDMPGYLSPEWYQQYEWRLVRKRVEEIALQAQHQDVYLCGTSANDTDIHDLVDSVIFLTIDEPTLRHRLATRQTNAFGKTEAELQHVLNWLKPAEEYYRNFGARMLDSTQNAEAILESILNPDSAVTFN